MSGGSVHPVNHGEMARAIHPEGAIKNATPMAIAACGVDNTGATNPPMRRAHEHPWAMAHTATASTRDTSVAAKPVDRLVITLVVMPGYAMSRRQGSSPNVLPPIAGK